MKTVMNDNFLKLMFLYPKKFHGLQKDFLFLPKRMKNENAEKLVANLHDKKKYVLHMKNPKQALKHQVGLKFYTDKNTELN